MNLPLLGSLLSVVSIGAVESADGGDLLALDAGVSQICDAGADSATLEVAQSPVDSTLSVDEHIEILLPDAGVAPPSSLSTTVMGTSIDRAAGSVHIIKSSKLKRFGLDDPMAILQSVPGVYARGEDGFGLRPNIGLRGANADRSKKVTLMEDGVLFGPAPYSAPAAYYFPLIARMESAQVVKGPSAVLYGPATVGGAVDFTTKDVPAGTVAGLDLAYGQYQYGKLHGYFGAGNETSGLLLEAIHIRSSGFKVLDGGGDTGFGRTEVMTKARHRISYGAAKHSLTAKFTASFEDSNETYLGLTDDDFRQTPFRRYVASSLDHMSNHRAAGSLTHRFSLGELEIQTTAYLAHFQRVWRRFDHFGAAGPADVLAAPSSPRNMVFYRVLTGAANSSSSEDQLVLANNNRQFLSAGVQSSLRARLFTGPIEHSLEVQARYHGDRAYRVHTGLRYDMRDQALVKAKVPDELLLNVLDDSQAFALAALDALRFWRVTLTPAMRVEFIRSRSFDATLGEIGKGQTLALLPGVGLHVCVYDGLGLFGGVYRGFSPPAPGASDFTRAGTSDSSEASSDLSEYSVNYEAGARWSKSGLRMEAIGFFNDYSNLTSLCTLSSGCSSNQVDTQFSAGRAHIYGVEAFVEKTFRFSRVTIPLSLAYTFTKTELLSSFRSADPQLGSVQAGDELPYVPAHQLNASAGIEIWKVSAHAQFNFVDRMRESAGQGPTKPGTLTDAQVTVDLNLGFKIFDWAQLYVDGRNITDNRVIVARRPFGARPNAPRTLIAGLKFRY